MYHKQVISRFENDSDYQLLTINKLNQILHQSSELSSEYLIRKTNKKYDSLNAPKYKIIPTDYVNQSKSKRDKKYN